MSLSSKRTVSKALPDIAPGNIFDLKLKENFDLVLATEIIEHCAHPDDLLRRLADFTKPGGFVLVTTPKYKGGWIIG